MPIERYLDPYYPYDSKEEYEENKRDALENENKKLKEQLKKSEKKKWGAPDD